MVSGRSMMRKTKAWSWLVLVLVAMLSLTGLVVHAQYGTGESDELAALVTSPLGEGQLLLVEMSGREEISQLFSYDLEMVSSLLSIEPGDVLGKELTVNVPLPNGKRRYINGFISRFEAGRLRSSAQREYRVEIVPWLWFLTLTSDSRIFQEKSVPDILGQLFSEYAFTDFDLRLSEDYPSREYVVQYRETDFNFVSRLMEEEGIFYYFEHEDGKHTLVLGDSPQAYVPMEGGQGVVFAGPLSPTAGEAVVSQWVRNSEFVTGKVSLNDYNFEFPSQDLLVSEVTAVRVPGMDKYERYDYPGLYQNRTDGERSVKVRMEEEEVPHVSVTGASNERRFSPGAKFDLTGHPSASENGEYFVVAARHRLWTRARSSAGGAIEDTVYENTFSAIPADVRYRPPRVTPKPLVQGIQTAVVVGPAGEEIFTDKYGRVKVQFHWDREGRRDENSSTWVRVAQSWGGSVFVPRIGDEVIVDFLEGDPDRPVVTGRLYNANDLPIPVQ